MNLAYWITHNARRLGDQTALIWSDKSWTWAQFDSRVSALAAALAEKGVTAGSTIVVHSKNSNEMFESMFAAFRLGAVWVPTNFRLMPEEVVYIAAKSKSRTFLCQSDFPEYADAICAARPDTQVLWMIGSRPAPDDRPQISELVSSRLGCSVANAAVDRDTACWFLFTSGTTGKPKAAVLTHGQMTFVVNNHLADLMPETDHTDGALVVAPLSHGAGVHQLVLVARGAKAVLLPSEKFSAEQAWELIELHRLTTMFTVPTILKMLVEHPSVDARDHSSLRFVVYAGAPMYEVDKNYALEKLGPVLVQYYGLGEVTGAISVLPTRDHQISGGGRPGTCGFERTGIELSVQDEEGRELGVGETGEICVIGPAVFVGYFDDPAANAKAFRNGWFRTGDLGYMDRDGYVYLTGRSSDMYISGGSNIYPRELEEKILTHEHIAEVAVVGLPDPQWGEAGVAVCVLKPGACLDEAHLLRWMSTRVARYKIPKRVLFWDQLPKSGYGKVPKRLVKDEIARRGLRWQPVSENPNDASH
jgi:fatty-acyl-CoA synthase